MLTKHIDNAEQEMDLPTLCRTVADACPMAMAGLFGSSYPSEESILLGFWADVTMGHDRRFGWGSS